MPKIAVIGGGVSVARLVELFAEQWSATLFNRLAFAKLSGELLLYGMMWYGMWRYCRPGNRLGWWLICLLGGGLLAVTFRAWLLQL